ncbi:MAG: integrase [Caulobacter vibrioides]|uniref:Integrase n=2 Tax=Caulobacter TaxID=75 RepID=A0A258D971_CAUVI|nr:MAG: integrase [Caulobacter vibrioides]
MARTGASHEPQSEERRWDLAVARQRELRPLLDNPNRTRAEVEAAAQRLNVHTATVYRLLARYAVGETAQAVVTGVGGWKGGRPRLHARVIELIDMAVERLFLDRQAISKAQLGREIARRCASESMAMPSRSVISRRLQRIGEREQVRRRKGPGAAEAVTMRPGSLTVTQPNAVWQIDHSPADVILVDADSRAPIGRPWVTLVIDVASRVVTGLYVSLDPPSVVSVGMALQHAILPKDEALAERGISAEWPAFGLPELVHTDNGSDFRSRSFSHACSNLGIETDRRPVGAPRYGGHIERLIGSVMSEMHLLPGATFSNVAARGDYASDAAAIMTIDEFEVWLRRFVAGDYNRRIHASLSAPPLETWRRLCSEQAVTPRQPLDPEGLAVAFLPRISRTITRQGVSFHHVRYYEPFLAPLFDSGLRRIELAYDPRDLSRLLVETPQGVRALRYRNLTRPPMSLWELRAARRRLRAEGRAQVDEAALFAAREANGALVATAARESRRIRRESVRRERHRAEVKPAPTAEDEIPPEPIDVGAPTNPTSGFVVEIEPW